MLDLRKVRPDHAGPSTAPIPAVPEALLHVTQTSAVVVAPVCLIIAPLFLISSLCN